MADEQPILAGLPGKSRLGRYVYVIEFSSGVVKVGMASSAATRFAQHNNAARIHGSSIDRHWVSPPHVRAGANEKALIEFCKRRADVVHGAEYFTGVEFDDVVTHAKGLSFPILSKREREQVTVDAQRTAKSIVNGFGRTVKLPPLMTRSGAPAEWGIPCRDTNELICRTLGLPDDVVDQLDEDDNEAVVDLLIAFYNAENDIRVIEEWLGRARERRDRVLHDQRVQLAQLLSDKHDLD
ncbi:hypothetical protein [Streptomyces sp. NPDC086519]|uniref:hypothetical protein n=1 Tax=Streptomyces sp. NPDC086519 TaxID=3154863 RepID=UPI00343EE4DE